MRARPAANWLQAELRGSLHPHPEARKPKAEASKDEVARHTLEKHFTNEKRRGFHRAVRNLDQADTRGLGSLDVDGLRALAHAIRLGVEGDLLAFAQRLDAGSLKSGDVDENVLCAAVRSDETKTLVLVEEFYGALGGHGG